MINFFRLTSNGTKDNCHRLRKQDVNTKRLAILCKVEYIYLFLSYYDL